VTHPRSCHPLRMNGALGAVQVSRCRRIIELRPVSRTPRKGVFGSDQGEERTFLTAALGPFAPLGQGLEAGPGPIGRRQTAGHNRLNRSYGWLKARRGSLWVGPGCRGAPKTTRLPELLSNGKGL
jgi:hypothetical protein